MTHSSRPINYLVFLDMWKSITAEESSTTIKGVDVPTKNLQATIAWCLNNILTLSSWFNLGSTNLCCFPFKQSLIPMLIQLRRKEFLEIITLNLTKENFTPGKKNVKKVKTLWEWQKGHYNVSNPGTIGKTTWWKIIHMLKERTNSSLSKCQIHICKRLVKYIFEKWWIYKINARQCFVLCKESSIKMKRVFRFKQSFNNQA